MEAGFDKLDAAGFLEIWQHFDADGEEGRFFYLVDISAAVREHPSPQRPKCFKTETM